jgi:hypothetical protein
MDGDIEEAGKVPEGLMGGSYMCRTPALHTTWQYINKEIPVSLHGYLEDCCFILLKPDMLASGKQDVFWDTLLATGVQPLVAWPCLRSGTREFEELYKFNLTVNNEQCMLSTWWLHNLPYKMGPVIGLLVQVPREVRGEQATAEFVAAHKGPSNPFLAKIGQWRYDMVSTNMALNLVHTSDDPISSVRELRVFGSTRHLRRALDRAETLARGGVAEAVTASVHGEFDVATDLIGYPRHDLDLVTNFVRIKLRLAQAIDTGRWLPSHLAEKFGALLRSGGTAIDRWSTYRSLCEAEEQLYGDGSAPEILMRLARPSEYRAELADLVNGEVHRYRLPYSEWERVVMDTSLFFHDHLPVT